MQTLFDQLAMATFIHRVFSVMSIGHMHGCRALQCYSNIRRFARMTTLASRSAAFRRTSAAPLNACFACRYGGLAPCLQACHGGPLLSHVLPAQMHNMLQTRGARWQSASHQSQSSLRQPSQASNEDVSTPDGSKKTPCVEHQSKMQPLLHAGAVWTCPVFITYQTDSAVVYGRCREQRAKAQRRATNSAAGMLSRRPHSERELRTKLADRQHEPEAIDAAVARLQELVGLGCSIPCCDDSLGYVTAKYTWAPCCSCSCCWCSLASVEQLAGHIDGRLHLLLQGMQDDREYAELCAQSKWRQSRWAPSRIRRVRCRLSSC